MRTVLAYRGMHRCFPYILMQAVPFMLIRMQWLHGHTCFSQCVRCASVGAGPSTHCAFLAILPHSCQIGCSAYVHEVAVCQLTRMGLPAEGGTEHLCMRMRENTAYTIGLPCEQGLTVLLTGLINSLLCICQDCTQLV